MDWLNDWLTDWLCVWLSSNCHGRNSKFAAKAPDNWDWKMIGPPCYHPRRPRYATMWIFIFSHVIEGTVWFHILLQDAHSALLLWGRICLATFIPFSVLVWNDMGTTLPCLSFGIPTRRGALVRPSSSRLSLSAFWFISHPRRSKPTWLDLDYIRIFHHQWRDFWISTSHLEFFVGVQNFRRLFFLDLFFLNGSRYANHKWWLEIQKEKLADTTDRNYLLQSTFFIVLGWWNPSEMI